MGSDVYMNEYSCFVGFEECRYCFGGWILALVFIVDSGGFEKCR